MAIEQGSSEPPAWRVADALADRLAAMIGAGEIGGGGRFPTERDLMARFGASRTSVRDAVAMLAHRGLLLTRPGYRPLVRKPDYDRAITMIGQFVAALWSNCPSAETKPGSFRNGLHGNG